MPKPGEKELLVLTPDEAESIMKTTMASYGVSVDKIPAVMKAQAYEGLAGLVRGLQLMGWTIERPKT